MKPLHLLALIFKAFTRAVFIIFFLFPKGIHSQNWDWVQTIGVDLNGSWGGHQSVNYLWSDKHGNTYATGRVKGYSRFGTGTNIITTTPVESAPWGAQTDVFIVKYNKYGDVLWANQDGGFAPDWGRGIATDDDGNIYVTGDYVDSVTFGSIRLVAGDSIYRNIFLLKLDSNGNYIWGKTFGGPEGDARPYGIALDETGGIYITGFITGITNMDTITIGWAGKYEGFIAKFNSDGSVMWGKIWNTNYPCQGNDIVYRNGAIYVAGYFKGAIWMGSVLNYGINPSWADGFFMKYDLNGNFLFGRTAIGNYEDSFEEIEVDSKGNIYVTGYFYGDLNFGDTTIYNPYNNLSSSFLFGFITKYDSAGNYSWVKVMGGDSVQVFPQGLNIDVYDNVYISASFRNAVQLDTFQIYSNYTSTFAASFDGLSAVRWVLKAEPLGNTGVQNQCASMDNYGNFYVGGIFYDSVRFGLTSVSADWEPYNSYIAKIIPPLSAGISISDSIICSGDSVTFSSLALGFPVTYYWLFDGGSVSAAATQTATVTYDSAGIFDLTLIIANPYEADTVFYSGYITVNPAPTLPFSLGPDTTVCTGYALNAGAEFIQYAWSDNSTEQSLPVYSSGQYFVQVTDSNYCKSRDTINLIVNPAPSVALGNDTMLCASSITLDAGAGYTSYLWSNGATTQGITVSSIGLYWVEVENSYGCAATDTLLVDSCIPVVEVSPAKSLAISLMPNPVNETAFFILHGNIPPGNIRIMLFDILGNTIINTDNEPVFRSPDESYIRFRPSTLVPGIFLYKIYSEDNLLATGKLIIE